METSERRTALLKTLCRRRHDTIGNLAHEFGVSERTIRRDIEIISLTEPIYTKTGRYDGGVYVMESYYSDRLYLNEEEIRLLTKVLLLVESTMSDKISFSEIKAFKRIIDDYSKPILPKERCEHKNESN